MCGDTVARPCGVVNKIMTRRVEWQKALIVLCASLHTPRSAEPARERRAWGARGVGGVGGARVRCAVSACADPQYTRS